MITQKPTIPDSSILRKQNEAFNYIDSFSNSFSDPHNKYGITEIMKLFITCGPRWAGSLMSLRDKIVKPFGLKTSEDTPPQQSENYEPGSQHGIFKIFDKTDNEIILGENDKHLNFKASLLLKPDTAPNYKRISITTAVKFNNLLGKIYFLPVRPFHKLIVKGFLKNIIEQIEKNNINRL